MAVTVKTPAAVTALTTVSAVKDSLGVSSSKFDKVLTRLIAAATDAIQEYVGHVYAKQTYTETVSGTGHPILMLTNVPIVGVPLVISDSSPVTDFEVRDALVGTLYRKTGWAHGEWVGWYTEPRRIPGTGDLNFSVEYEAGYVMPTEEDRDLPAAIEQACIETVVAWYKRRSRDTGVKSKKVGDLNISYGDGGEESSLSIPASARALLSRRVR